MAEREVTMEMMDEHERYLNGNLLRDLGARALDKLATVIEGLADIDEAMDVFPED
jgi:hypothetical protein